MSSAILSVLEYMEKEKGISRQDMIETISLAIKNAAQKGDYANQELKIDVNPRSGALKAWVLYRVVDSVSDAQQEIHIEKAKQIDPEIQLGALLEKPLDPSYLGRIAAQTARQAIMQKIRSFEKERIYEDFKGSVGDIVSGVVRRRERSDWVVDLGKAEALLPLQETIFGEVYNPGDRIRCLLLCIESTVRGPEIILSRSSPDFVRRLLEIEVNEIGNKIVNIEHIVREAGYRTKIAVSSKDQKIDPVGACVGPKGVRIKSLVRELNGEKIDVLRYYEDPVKMLEEAFKPVVLKYVKKDDRDKRILIEVQDEDVSSIIGKKGLNIKLSSQLIKWKIDINKSVKSKTGVLEERIQKAIEGVNKIPGLESGIAERLVTMGITSIEAFEGVTLSDLEDAGFTSSEAENTLQLVQDFKKSKAI